MSDVREKFVTKALVPVIRVRDTFGEVLCIDLGNDPLVTFFFAIFVEEHQVGWTDALASATMLSSCAGADGLSLCCEYLAGLEP